ncbi:MAG TPA: chemotaxis protein CheD [Smithella sp.]|nr:chemotaxis protein CheD [Smithella sp.]
MVYTVGVADLKISGDVADLLITYALGSCLGITIYDVRQRKAGLLHCMLPDSGIDRNKAAGNPCLYVDSGMKKMLDDFYRKGSRKHDLIIRVAGGSSSKENEEEDFFKIGRRNFVSLRKYLWSEGLMLKAYDVGGYGSRTVTLEVENGKMLIKSKGSLKEL